MLQWTLNGGGEARVDRSDGVRVTVLSSRPFPPGATLSGRTVESLSAAEFQVPEFQVKVRDCRAVEGGRFWVEGRFVSLAKRVRLELLRALDAAKATDEILDRS